MEKNKIKYTQSGRILPIVIAIISLFTVVTSISVGLLLGYLKELPIPETLEHYSPPQVTKVYDRTGDTVISELFTQKRVVIPLKEIPPKVINAFIATEDERFYSHIGIDPTGILRALIVDLKSGGMRQGGSTITQQLSRNVFEELSQRRTLERKIKEALFSLYVEKRYTKEQILEFYLNQIYLGSGTYGVKAAAEEFFNKDLKDLSISECAVIAGIPSNPSKFSPLRNIEASKKRRDLVLKRMYDAKFITVQEYINALSEPITLNRRPPLIDKAPYFVDYMRKGLTRDKRFSEDALFKEGFQIYTTIDMKIQELAEKCLHEGLQNAEQLWQKKKKDRFDEENNEYGNAPPTPNTIRLAKIDQIVGNKIRVSIGNYHGEVNMPKTLPYYDPKSIIKTGNLLDVVIAGVDAKSKTITAQWYDNSRVQGAMVVIDPHNGEILALVGGDDFFDDKGNKGIWKNRALTKGGRQVGSSFKPFFYAAALEKGYTAGSVFYDRKIVFGNGYAPENYEGEFYKWTTLQEALEHSRNVVSILLYQSMGVVRANKFVRQFDFTGNESQWDLPAEINTVLGTIDATPLELAAAYSAFANNGVAEMPRSVKYVTNQRGEFIKRYKPSERKILSPENAYIINTMLRGAVLRGTASFSVGDVLKSADQYPEVAGKTGTTNDCVCAWFNGYTPDLLVIVYVGFDKNRTLGPKMTGGIVAAPIFTKFLQEVVKTRKNWKMKFDRPEDIINVNVCSKSGKLWTSACGAAGCRMLNIAFKKGTEPTQSCDGSHHTGGGEDYPSEDAGAESGQNMQPITEQNLDPQ